MSIKALEKQVIEWARDRGIFEGSDIGSRHMKFEEECTELMWELFPPCLERNNFIPVPIDIERVKLEAGDVLVTLINLLHPMGLDLETCLDAAYQKIKDRKGRMINGSFVKSEDIE
jgi:NTP pyrophosphatase (non-canonical NTP hydrolase)